MGRSKLGDWFASTVLAPGLTRLTEPHVHPFLSANMFFLAGRDCDLLIDTGMGLLPLTPALPLTPGKPVLAMATHIHVDHVGGLHEFDHRLGPAYAAKAFATMPEALTYAGMFAALDQPVSVPPSPGWDIAHYALIPAPLTRTLAEGDTVDLGDRTFRVLHLPGHSPDSIALLDEADGLFFSGDAIYDDTLIDDLPDSDREAYRATMRRLLDLDARLVLGGHGHPFDGVRMHEVARAYLDRRGG